MATIDVTPEEVKPAGPAHAPDPIERCILWVLAYCGRPMSAAAVRARVARLPGPWSMGEAIEALESLGVRCEERSLALEDAVALQQPCMLATLEGAALLLTGRGEAGLPETLGVLDHQQPAATPLAAIRPRLSGTGWTFTPPLRLSNAAGAQAQGRYGHWFWGPILQGKSLYVQVLAAAFFTNVFALVASVFSMIVYDRVMPNNAIETLTALVIGVVLILIGDFVIRTLRAHFLDVAGARADIVIADALFDHVIDLQLRAKRGSVGHMSTVLREFESVREMLTSATLTTLIDLPFALLFVAVIWAIGGPLVWVPLLAIPVVLGVSLAIQPQMRALVQAGYEDGLNKQSVVVETLHGIETIKSLGAGSVMRRRWQDAIGHQAEIGLRTRFLGQLAGNAANLASQAVWVGTVTMGVFLVRDGQIGSGAIVACSMLAGRTISPLAQLAQLLTRLNQTLASYKSLRALMAEPREHTDNDDYLSPGTFKGAIEFRDVSFRYPDQRQGGLEKLSFRIEAGERVAILGRIGSGKTTIAKLILGLYRPDEGAVLLDGMDVRQIDPAELRRNVGAVLQEVWLMSGTVKQNIALGAENPTDDEILQASQIAGVHDFIAPHPDGYGMRLRERGEGLSGGQRQAISIARALVGAPPVLLLDEPTSSMDTNAERQLIERLKSAGRDQTTVIITHRGSLLDLVDRVIVIDRGTVVANGPKEQVLRGAQPQGAAPRAPAA